MSIVIAILALAVAANYVRIPVSFTPVATAPITALEHEYSKTLWWFRVFPEGDYFADEQFDLDFENYAYIVTVGHELSRLRVSFSARRQTSPPREFHGIVTLQDEPTDNIYIYRIRKWNIEHNFKMPSSYVSFVSGREFPEWRNTRR